MTKCRGRALIKSLQLSFFKENDSQSNLLNDYKRLFHFDFSCSIAFSVLVFVTSLLSSFSKY